MTAGNYTPVASTSTALSSSLPSSSLSSLDPIGPTPSPTPRPRRRPAPAPDSLDYALLSGLAGGIAGCVAKTSVAPLDRVKILFQTKSPDYARYAGKHMDGVFKASRDIYQETGVRGLLQGHSATLMRIFPYAAIKFMAYDKFHIILMPTAQEETSGRRFLAGSLAGITSAIFTYPLELIRVRLAFESHHDPNDRASLIRTIRQIYREPPLPLKPRVVDPGSLASMATATAPIRNSAIGLSEGVAAAATLAHQAQAQPAAAATATAGHALRQPSLTHFYRGIWPTLFGIVPYAGTSFVVWGFLKSDLLPRYLSPELRDRHRAALDLVAGGIAGALGQTAAYPLDIVRRRMQVAPATETGARARADFWATAAGIYRTSGWRGFFVGLSIGYLKVAPMNAVSFTVWEGMKNVLGLPAKGVGHG